MVAELVMSSQLIQIYYEEKQKKELFPFARPYYNEGLTIFFENSIIAEEVLKCETEAIAVCSWRLAQKMRLHRQKLLETGLKSDYQVLGFQKYSERHSMMANSNVWHGGFTETISLLWQKLGYKMPGDTKNPIYQNHFAARTSIYKDYIENFLKPAMELTLTDEELNKKMTQATNYGNLSNNARVDRVKKFLGLSDYPLAPFVLERCPSLFFEMKRIPVTYL